MIISLNRIQLRNDNEIVSDILTVFYTIFFMYEKEMMTFKKKFSDEIHNKVFWWNP